MAERFVERVVLVGDDAIQEAQESLLDVLRVATEPGGPAPPSSSQTPVKSGR
jgi:hypothetical protein